MIVDYLQLMRADDPRANRVEQVGQMSRGLKILARELEVPVLAISQLSRAPEQRRPPKPMLSDLRESGCLTGDSLVYLPREGVRRPIRELVGQTNFEVLAMDPETWKLRTGARRPRPFQPGTSRPSGSPPGSDARCARPATTSSSRSPDGAALDELAQRETRSRVPGGLPGPSGHDDDARTNWRCSVT